MAKELQYAENILSGIYLLAHSGRFCERRSGGQFRRDGIDVSEPEARHDVPGLTTAQAFYNLM